MLVLVVPIAVFAEQSQQQAQFATPKLVAGTSFLNIRTGPGIEYEIMSTVVGGTELPVLSVAKDKVWYKVNTTLGPGWVNVAYTVPRGDFRYVPFDDDVVTNAGQGGGGSAAVSGGGSWGVSVTGGSLFSQPSNTSAKIVSPLYENLNVVYPLFGTTYADGILWYHTNVDGNVGWLSQGKIRPLICGTSESAIVIIQDSGVEVSGGQSFAVPGGTEAFAVGAESPYVLLRFYDGTVGKVGMDLTRGRDPQVASHCSDVGVGGGSSVNPGQGGGSVASTPNVRASSYAVIGTGNLNVRTGPGAQYSIVTSLPYRTEVPVIGRSEDGIWYLIEGGFGRGWINSYYSVFRGAYNSVAIISGDVEVENPGQGGGGSAPVSNSGGVSGSWGVSVVGGSLWDKPSESGAKLKSPLYENRSVVYPLYGTTSAEGKFWYQTNIDGVVGWLDHGQIRPLKCSPNDSVGVVINDAGVEVVNGQSFSVPGGTEAYTIGVENGRAKLQFYDGSIGFVGIEHVQNRSTDITSICSDIPVSGGTVGDSSNGGSSSMDVSKAAARVVIGTGNLNVRSGPGAAYSVVTSLPYRTEVAVIGRTPEALWYLVEGDFGRGWVNAPYVVFRGHYASVQVIEYEDISNVGTLTTAPSTSMGGDVTTAQSAPEQQPVTNHVSGNRVVVGTGNLNVRSGPSAGFPVISTVPFGVELPVLGRTPEGLWYLVEGDFGRGWVNAPYVTFRGVYSTLSVVGEN